MRRTGSAKKIMTQLPNPLRMTDSSLAQTYGISRQKEPPKPVLGLNPNLTFEDEYIENLLKQIKLIKEKQAQHKGTGLLGLLSKETMPPVDHVFSSNQKFKEMKQTLTQELSRLQAMNVRLEDQNLALRSKKFFLKNIQEQEEEKERNRLADIERVNKDFLTKISTEANRAEEIARQIQKGRKMLEQEQSQLNRLKRSLQSKSLNQAIDSQVFQNERKFEEEEMALRKEEVNGMQSLIQTKKSLLEGDMKFKEMEKERKELEGRLKLLEKDMSSEAYRTKQLEMLIGLYEGQRDSIIIEKNNLAEELDKVKGVLQDTRKVNQAKINRELKVRQMESIEIRKAQTALVKSEKDLAEARKRIEKCEETIRKNRLEVDQMSREQEKGQAENEVLSKELTTLLQRQEALIQEKDLLSSQSMELSSRHHMMLEEIEKTRAQFHEVQEEHEYVRARLAYMQQNIRLEDQLKQINVQDLRMLVDNNKEMSSTVSELLRQWQTMRALSK